MALSGQIRVTGRTAKTIRRRVAKRNTGMTDSAQRSLFDAMPDPNETGRVLLYALGDFQSRKKILANRELALDRLRGAFKRAFEKFSVKEPSDASIAEVLGGMGAKVTQVPTFVAKHPFRVTIPEELAAKARAEFEIRQGKT